MAPKVKVTREDIVTAAIELVRQHGIGAVNARSVAEVLNCSTQPVFSNFPTMEALRTAVWEESMAIYDAYLRREAEENTSPAYKAEGMAYIRFAKEERELFKLLYMRDRKGQETETESNSFSRIATIVHHVTGLDMDTAARFHLEMWALVHGIATMFATNYLALDWDLVSGMISDVYIGLRNRYGLEG